MQVQERHKIFKILDEKLASKSCTAFQTQDGLIFIVITFNSPFEKHRCICFYRHDPFYNMSEDYFLLPSGDCIYNVSTSINCMVGTNRNIGSNGFSRSLGASNKQILESKPVPFPEKSDPPVMTCWVQPHLDWIYNQLSSNAIMELEIDNPNTRKIIQKYGYEDFAGFVKSKLESLELFLGMAKSISKFVINQPPPTIH